MRNREQWRPSKYVLEAGALVASREVAEVAVGSRLVADIVARHYQTYVPAFARGRLVDLGCGKVPLFGLYRDYVTDAVCVDWKSGRHDSEHVDLWCDLSRRLPFRDGEFDTAILSDVLEHVPEPERLWAELARIVRANGRVFVNVPFLYCIHEAPHDYFRYTEHALRRFAELSGFQVLLLKPVGGTPEVLADILAKHLQFVPWVGPALAAALQAMTAMFLRTGIGRRASARTAAAFPLGYFLVAERRGVVPDR